MRSSAWRRLSLFAALLAAGLGCGRGVDTLAITAPPLAYVHGHFDLAAATAAAKGHKLRGALVWGATPNFILACFKYASSTPELAAVCPDSFGFYPGTAGAEVEIDPALGGDFTLTIDHLPDARVAIGTEEARISWGSLIVAADMNDSGTFELVGRLPDQTQQGERIHTANVVDLAVAASFTSLIADQQRVAFREGGWDASSLFYPAPGCAPPPVSFSLLFTPGMTGTAPNPYAAREGDCVSTAVDGKAIELSPISASDAKALACRQVNAMGSAFVRRPDSDAMQGRPGQAPEKSVCLDNETLALIPSDGDCPQIQILPLAGCRNTLACNPYDWDLRSNPPDWWPCGN